MKRIQFEGDTALCGKWLPYAKSKMDALSRLYAGRRNWVWETIVGDVRIGLERNGNIEYIRIRAATGGYEFNTAFKQIAEPEGTLPLTDVKFGLVNRFPDLTPGNEGEFVLEQRNRNKRPFIGLPDDLADQKDAFLYARKWDELFLAGDDEIYPMMDWFSISLPSDQDEIDRRMLNGYSGSKWVITTGCDTGRHHDLSGGYAQVDGGLGASNYGFYASSYLDYAAATGKTILRKRNGRSQILDVLGNDGFTAAVQSNEFVIGGIDRGELYGFFVYHPKRDLYFDIDLFFLRPPWLYGTSRARWYWRGDGKRCISLQYDAYSTDPTKTIRNEVIVDTTIHEFGFEIAGIDDDDNLDIGLTNNFSTRNHAGRPIAVDYDLFDGHTRRVLVLEPWIGPIFDRLPTFANYYGSPDPDKCRSLLIYANFCTVDDAGNISAPYRSIPVYHKPWMCMVLAGAPAGLDEFGYHATYPGNALGSDEFYDRFGHNGFCSRIAALDMRAQAIAMYTQVLEEVYPGTPTPWYVEYETPYYNKRWTIWGEPGYRENIWVDGSGNPATPATDPIQSVATPPVDYVRYDSSHPLWTGPIIGQDLNPAYEEITRNLFNVNAKPAIYNGFRISPRKHFALYAQNTFEFYQLQEPGVIVVTPIPEAVKSFLSFDHVEWFMRDEAGDPAPIISNHYDLFNIARSTAYVEGDGEIESMCANGLWVI